MTLLFFSIHVHIWEYDFFMYLAAHIILENFSYHCTVIRMFYTQDAGWKLIPGTHIPFSLKKWLSELNSTVIMSDSWKNNFLLNLQNFLHKILFKTWTI